MSAATDEDRTHQLHPDAPGRVLVLAQDADAFTSVLPTLRGLVMGGHKVVLVWRDGEPAHRLRAFGGRVQLEGPPRRSLASWRRSATALVTRRAQGRRTKAHHPLARDVLASPRARRELTEATVLLPADEAAGAAIRTLGQDVPPTLGRAEISEWARISRFWAKVDARLAAGQARLNPPLARRILEHARRVGGTVPESAHPHVVALVRSLHDAGRYELALEVAGLLDTESEGVDSALRAERRGLRALAQTSASGRPAPDLTGSAAALISATDHALEQQDVPTAARLTSLALSLLFHRELHMDGLSSPLVESPDEHLAAWRGSRVGDLLASASPRRPRTPRPSGETGEDGQRTRVVVVPGTYPQFSRPVVEALEESAQVHLVDLAARNQLRGMAARLAPVEARLRQALGEEIVLDEEVLAAMEGARAVFVDWADPGALATVMAVPEGIRVILRIHSADALSPWIHLLDWSRVDHLVLVSQPLRDVVERLLGERLRDTAVHVVPNVVDLDRLPGSRLPGHLRRLVMVGWGQQVKDPIWALEVLAILRRRDPSWRLTLLGTDFPQDAIRSQRAYARRFRQRLAQEDVSGAVDFPGFTRDVGPHLAAAGFVLSTSRRESFGLGLVEAAASGAVPVVRDWPIFAPVQAARTLFPDSWVVQEPEEAAQRILALSEEEAWTRASEEVRSVVAERFGTGQTRETYRRLVLGEADTAGT